MIDVVRRSPPSNWHEHTYDCDACGWTIQIKQTPEGGEYRPYPERSFFGASCDAAAQGNIWLAGCPDGTTSGTDSAPANTPTELNIDLTVGHALVFTSTGACNTGVALMGFDAEGDSATITARTDGAANGIGDFTAPNLCAIGVFLTDDSPVGETAPADPDYTLLATRNYSSISPSLRQPFFFGLGRHSTSDAYRQVIVPSSATRLFVGCHIAGNYSTNKGSYRISVASAPSSNYTTYVEDIDTTTGRAYLSDRAYTQGCPFCGCPLWRRGGKLPQQ